MLRNYNSDKISMNARNGTVLTSDFWLLLFILFLMPIAGMHRLMGKPVQISDILFLVYFLMWFPKRIFLGKFRLNAKLWLFCGMFIIFCLSVYFSPFPQKSLFGLAVKIYLLSLAYVISEEIDSVIKFNMAVNTVLFSGVYVIALSFLGIASFIAGRPSIFLCPGNILDLPLRFLPRVQSTFSSPSFLSSFLAIIILLLIEKILKADTPFMRRRHYTFYLASTIAVFIFTFSRDLVGLGWGLIFLFTLKGIRQERKRLIMAYSKLVMLLITIFVLICSIWYIFPVKIYKSFPGVMPISAEVQYNMEGGRIISQMGWISEKFVSFNAKLHNRLIEMRDSGKTFIKNPILGIGIGVLPSQGYFPNPYSRSSHNTYLQTLAQTGILGLILFSVFIISLFRAFPALGQDNPLYDIKPVFKAILLILLINMVFTDLDNFRYFWIIAGFMLSFKNLKVKNA